jgi:hypothetical protein
MLLGTIPMLLGTMPMLLGTMPMLLGPIPMLLGPIPMLLGTIPMLLGTMPMLAGTMLPEFGIMVGLTLDTMPMLPGTIPLGIMPLGIMPVGFGIMPIIMPLPPMLLPGLGIMPPPAALVGMKPEGALLLTMAAFGSPARGKAHAATSLSKVLACSRRPPALIVALWHAEYESRMLRVDCCCMQMPTQDFDRLQDPKQQ